jgi:endoribonuclease LACTB2
MTPQPALTIVNVGYRSTNYWVISVGRSRLLVDIGWPGTLASMRANLARKDVPIEEIRYALATHYHMDHAGLAEELKPFGVKLLVVDVQLDAIAAMKKHMKPTDHYVEITPSGNVTIPVQASRALLGSIGIAGEILHTPGHSDDSVSLLLDDGSAFIGDLTYPGLETEDNGPAISASWRALLARGASLVYPGHGPIRYPPAAPEPESGS